MALAFSYTLACDPSAGVGQLTITAVTGGVAPYQIELTLVPGTGVPYLVQTVGTLPYTLAVANTPPTQGVEIDLRDNTGAVAVGGIETVACVAAPPEATTTPPDLAAAHLPVLCVIEASPTGIPLQPAALLLIVEVYRGAWVFAGSLRGLCDTTTGTARFDLSEYLKTQFSATPPDESGGNDAALAIPYRVRYGRVERFDGTAGDEAGSFEGLTLNAAEVVNPTGAALPLPLGPVAPYDSVPTGFARFRSTVDATGVKNVATVPVVATGCAYRQFVWLHPSGAWVWGLFGGKHEHGTETTDDVVVRRAKGEDYYVGGGEVRDTLKVYSDKINWPEFQVLRTIRRSRRVYERLASGLYVPVLIEKGAFPDYRETDKLFSVDFTVRYPVQVVQTF